MLLVTAALLSRECKGVLVEDKTTSRREKDGVEAKGRYSLADIAIFFSPKIKIDRSVSDPCGTSYLLVTFTQEIKTAVLVQ